MPLNFPTSPSDGQIYEGYQWDATKQVWVSGRYSEYRPASESVLGIVELATNAETQAGSSTTLATTPAGVASATVSKTNGTVTTASTSSGVVRNIYTSTSLPSGGIDGDLWMVYT